MAGAMPHVQLPSQSQSTALLLLDWYLYPIQMRVEDCVGVTLSGYWLVTCQCVTPQGGGAGLVLWVGCSLRHFWVLPARSIPKPD